MRKKLTENEKKVTLSVTINPVLMVKLDELQKNKSKYIEWLIYQDLKKNNMVDEIML